VKLEEIEGIGPAYAGKLAGAGVSSADDLMNHGATKAGRATLAAAAGVDESRILTWVNHVDLMRLDGVGSEYADLLEAAGVDSCAELAQRNAANLTARLAEVNEAKDLVRRLPSEATVTAWITEAATHGKIVSH
jgi:predicted flap endonuclease-1-like 5' DNA nuclease